MQRSSPYLYLSSQCTALKAFPSAHDAKITWSVNCCWCFELTSVPAEGKETVPKV